MKQDRKTAFSKLAKTLKGMTEEQKLDLIASCSITNVDGKALSLNNAVLMCMQRSEDIPTIVGGYRQWQSAGRQVQAGQKGMSIWYPSRKKSEDGEEEKTRFFVGTVFDIAQTEVIENGENTQL